MAHCRFKQEVSMIALGTLISSLAWGGTDLRPSWMGVGKGSPTPESNANYSFLSDVDSNVQEAQAEAMERQLFEAKRTAQLRQDYEILARDYELRQIYGLNDPNDELRYHDKFKERRSEAFSHVRSRQLEKARKNLKAGAERGEVGSPVMFAATLAAIVDGEPVRMSLGENTRVSARTDLIDERAEVRLRSPVINGTFDYASDKAFEEMKRREPDREHEQYRLSLSRGLPVLDMSSGVAYGGTSDKVSFSLSKPLSQNLACIFENSLRMRDSRVEEKVTFQYDIRF